MKEKILDMLVEVCEDDVIKEELEIDLFEAGLLDSLSVAQMLFEIEDRFQIVISPSEITHEDINTVQKIIELIMARGNV